MKAILYCIVTGKEDWVEAAVEKYQKKISFYLPFSVEALRPTKLKRDDSEFKKKQEEETFLERLRDSDYVILFDEKGSSVKGSIEFSKKIVQAMESSKQRIVFVIGGAYGIGDKLRARADLTLSFSSLTFSHHVAMIVALEQIYRGFTIWKNHPYHNG